MFIDASALTAMIVGEEDALELASRLERAIHPITSPLSVWESTLAVSRIFGFDIVEAQSAVEDYLTLRSIRIMPIPAEAASGALDAYRRYGKTRHPAGLNFGDCFSYACARHYKRALLYKGSDFSKTDLAAG